MVNYLSTLDFILIFIYFIILLLIGYFTSKKQKSEDYLIAERKLNSWSTMMTMNASKTGSIVITFVALVYLWGFSAIWYFIGVIVGVFLFIPFALKLKDKEKGTYYTLADYFKYNYGKIPAVLASIISIFLMVGLAIINIIAGTKIFVFFTGWSFWLCSIIMVSIIFIYLFYGGFRAVVKTDILQYSAMLLIIFLILISIFKGTNIGVLELNFFTTTIITVVGFFIVGIMFPFASPDMWQRVYSAKGKKELRNGLLLSNLFYFIFALLLTFLALVVKMNYPLVNPDLALIYGFVNLLPVGLVGLSMVLLFSAIMSSVDTYLFTGASAVIQDFFKVNKKDIINLIKTSLFIIALICTGIAILIQDLVISSYIIASFYSVIAIPTIASWVCPKIKPISLTFSFIFGLLFTIIFLIFSLKKGDISAIIVIGTIIATFLGLFFGKIVLIFKNKLNQ